MAVLARIAIVAPTTTTKVPADFPEVTKVARISLWTAILAKEEFTRRLFMTKGASVALITPTLTTKVAARLTLLEKRHTSYCLRL